MKTRTETNRRNEQRAAALLQTIEAAFNGTIAVTYDNRGRGKLNGANTDYAALADEAHLIMRAAEELRAICDEEKKMGTAATG